MTRAVRTEEDIDELTRHLLDPARDRPVVALTSRIGDETPAFDPVEVRAELGAEVDLYVIPTGSRTFELGDRISKERGVFGGAARIWWPGFTTNDRPLHHPLIFDRHGVYGSQALDTLVTTFGKGPTSQPAVVEATGDELLVRKTHGLEQANERLLQELATAREEVDDWRTRSRAAEERARDAQKELRSARVGPGEEAAGQPDLEEGLYRAVVDCWLGEHPSAGERAVTPLRPFVLGHAFAESVDALDVEADRVARVCAWVLDGRAEDMRSLAVHKLRSGRGGEDPQRSRADGARAWRVNLKVNTPGAPRLHYWVREDGVVEFASVNHHDDLEVPE